MGFIERVYYFYFDTKLVASDFMLLHRGLYYRDKDKRSLISGKGRQKGMIRIFFFFLSIYLKTY